MIEVFSDDSTKGMSVPEVLDYANMALSALHDWFMDLAKRSELDDYERQVIKGCEGMIVDLLTEVENLEGVRAPAPSPQREDIIDNLERHGCGYIESAPAPAPKEG